MSCYGCDDKKKEPTLAERLNKRITVLRHLGEGDWFLAAGNEGAFEYQDTKTYNGALSGAVFWSSWIPNNQDEYGQPLDDLIEVTTVWAGIEPLQGRELYAAKAENAEVTTRIPIRYREGIDRTMIVRYKGFEFEILYTINPKFENKELQLICKERQ